MLPTTALSMDARRCYFDAKIMAETEVICQGSSWQDVSVTDVYDQAAGIACEFDKMINVYGSECVTELMPKVIRALEQLETLASRFEKDNEEIATLKSVVEKLESEKAEKAQERARFEQEVEAIEDNWQKEVKGLLSVVSSLQDENKRLKEKVQNEKYAVEEKISAKFRENEEQEIKVLTKLKDTVDRQREDMRAMKRDITQKSIDCEALQAQLEQIAKINSDLRRKNNTHKKQARVLLEEKADLEIQLRDKEAQVEKVKTMISEQEKFEEQRAAVRAAIAEQQHNDDVHGEDEHDGCHTSHPAVAETQTSIESDQSSNPTSPGLLLDGKLIIDLKDPNRPRFTMMELRQVLMERNELKTRLIEVQEELQHYRPRGPDDEESEDSDESSGYAGQELPVYGPINKEPDEKIFGVKESGIRKLFLRVLEAGLNLLGDRSDDQNPAGAAIPEYVSLRPLQIPKLSRRVTPTQQQGTRERETLL